MVETIKAQQLFIDDLSSKIDDYYQAFHVNFKSL